MKDNPYAASQLCAADNNSVIRFRDITGRFVFFSLTSDRYRNNVRNEAVRAIDTEIGPEHIVSIVEQEGAFGGFSVIVWYRAQAQLS